MSRTPLVQMSQGKEQSVGCVERMFESSTYGVRARFISIDSGSIPSPHTIPKLVVVFPSLIFICDLVPKRLGPCRDSVT